MALPYEENILRVLRVSKSAQIPEVNNLNPLGLNETEAKALAYKHKLDLRILSSNLMPEFRVFEFTKPKPTSNHLTVQSRGGEEAETFND